MLRKGQRFSIGAIPWKVAYVNLSRAHCVAEGTKQVTVTDKRTGEARTFQAHLQATMDISPNTPVELLKDLR